MAFPSGVGVVLRWEAPVLPQARRAGSPQEVLEFRPGYRAVSLQEAPSVPPAEFSPGLPVSDLNSFLFPFLTSIPIQPFLALKPI